MTTTFKKGQEVQIDGYTKDPLRRAGCAGVIVGTTKEGDIKVKFQDGKIGVYEEEVLEELPDSFRSEYMFNTFPNYLLVKIAKGEIDPVALAKQQLADRGYNNSGSWVGFKK